MFIDPKDAETMTQSLQVIAALEFDVLLPGLYQGDFWRAEVTKDELRERVDEIAERLKQGTVH